MIVSQSNINIKSHGKIIRTRGRGNWKEVVKMEAQTDKMKRHG